MELTKEKRDELLKLPTGNVADSAGMSTMEVYCFDKLIEKKLSK